MSVKLMDGTYYEIVGGMEEDIIKKVEEMTLNDQAAKDEAINTERVAYRNTYKCGKRIESICLWDPFNDECFLVGTEQLYYEPLPKDKAFAYSMLGRLKSDCEYFLGNGNGYEGHLWAQSVEEQIKEMRGRWNSFTEDEKPEWLTMDQIDEYEQKMLEKRKENQL